MKPQHDVLRAGSLRCDVARKCGDVFFEFQGTRRGKVTKNLARKREKTISERNTQLALAKANLDLVRAKVAANTQKAFLDLERTARFAT
jgi:hypothetical protein